MSLSKGTLLVMGLAAIGVVSGAAALAIAQAPSQDVISKLENNQGIFVDKKSFDVVKGASAKGDRLATLTKIGAREVSAGAIIFRSGDKLYIVDGTPPADLPPQAVKGFPKQLECWLYEEFPGQLERRLHEVMQRKASRTT